MFKLFNVFFGHLWFGFGDLDGGGGDPSGQPDPADSGNVDDDGEGEDTTPTDEISIGEHRVTLDDLRNNERLKDYFDAYDNREKWQAKLTQEAQTNAEAKRKAEAYERLIADPRFSQPAQRPQNETDVIKQEFIQMANQKWGQNYDPAFVEAMFDAVGKMSGVQAKQTIDPVLRHQGAEFERRFLEKHPDVTRGSQEYQEISELVAGGVDAEKAYNAVFHDKILQAKVDEAMKARDANAKRKLQQSRQSTGQPHKVKGATRSEKLWDAILYHDPSAVRPPSTV